MSRPWPCTSAMMTRWKHNPGRCTGFTLTEMMVAVTILCVLFGMATPVYHKAVEQARLDNAVRKLGVIWSAQRVYWLDAEIYCDDLETLEEAGLLCDSEITDTASDDFYAYTLVSADTDGFVARATRQQSTTWSGDIEIDETGEISGGVTGTDGTSLVATLGE